MNIYFIFNNHAITCIVGQCNCTHEYFGSDCSLEKSQAPILAPASFNGVCDTSLRNCQTYIVPGINFRKGDLVCRYRPFKVKLSITMKKSMIFNDALSLLMS